MGLWHTNGSPNFGQKTRPYNNQPKKNDKLTNCGLCCAGNMKGTIIPTVIGIFGTDTKGLLKGLEDLEVGGRLETIQTTT